jgi:hypothetical protein
MKSTSAAINSYDSIFIILFIQRANRLIVIVDMLIEAGNSCYYYYYNCTKPVSQHSTALMSQP